MLLVEGEADFEFLVAVVHEVLEDDRGGDNQRADDKRCDVVEEEIADGARLRPPSSVLPAVPLRARRFLRNIGKVVLCP